MFNIRVILCISHCYVSICKDHQAVYKYLSRYWLIKMDQFSYICQQYHNINFNFIFLLWDMSRVLLFDVVNKERVKS
jgi:hypothetical protein